MTHRLLALALGSATLIWPAPAGPNDPASVKLTALELQRESISKQRDSLKQQSGVKAQSSDIDFELLPPLPVLAESDCPALERQESEELIASAAKRQSLSPQLIRAVMRQESGFKPCALSIKGAQGLMQLMPETAAQLHVADPFDPVENVQAGAAYLKQLLKKYGGDVRLALVAYNAGATRADQLAPAQYPVETQGYLANIFAELGNPEPNPVQEEQLEPEPQN